MLNDFGGQLGKTDTEGQLKHLELYEVSFSKQLSSALDAITKNQSYIKQWIFCRKCNRPYDDLEVVMDVELIFQNCRCRHNCCGSYPTSHTKRSRGAGNADLACRTYSCVDADNNANQHSVQHNKTAFRFLI